MIRGVLAYANEHPDFQIITASAIPYIPLQHRNSFECDGIIGYAESKSECEQLAAARIPAVNVTLHQPPLSGLPVVHSDNLAIGQVAAEHLLQLGLRSFAFVGHQAWFHNQQRCVGFRQTVEVKGNQFQEISVRFGQVRGTGFPSRSIVREALARDLAKLPHPVGVLAAHDEFAAEVVSCLTENGLTVPHDVAVLGVNNYSLICEATSPPLTSVSQRSETIGYEAAALLSRLMSGESSPAEPLLIAPGPVLVRRSTDYLAISDRTVVEAMGFIEANCHRPIRTVDVVHHVALRRGALDAKFIDTLGQSVAEVLRSARVRRAKNLLVSSRLDILEIGVRCGFDSKSGFTRAFVREVGMLPSEFRKKAAPSNRSIGMAMENE